MATLPGLRYDLEAFLWYFSTKSLVERASIDTYEARGAVLDALAASQCSKLEGHFGQQMHIWYIYLVNIHGLKKS